MNLCDCHCHTERSACAEDVTLEWYVQMAGESSQGFAITDHSAHIYYPPDDKWTFWTEDAREVFEANRSRGDAELERYIADVRGAQTGGMMLGIELDMFIDGTPVCDENRLGEFDIVLGAAHTWPALQNGAEQEVVEEQFKVMVQRLVEAEVDILAHPFRPMVLKEYLVPDDLIEWLVEFAGEHDLLLEINSHSICRGEDLRMGRLAQEQGVGLTLGTDTHRKSEFGDFTYHFEIADALEVPAEQLYWRPMASDRPQAAQ